MLQNAKLYLSARVCAKHGVVYKRNSWGEALNIMETNKGFLKQQKFDLVEEKQTFTFLYQKNH